MISEGMRLISQKIRVGPPPTIKCAKCSVPFDARAEFKVIDEMEDDRVAAMQELAGLILKTQIVFNTCVQPTRVIARFHEA